MKFHIEQIAFAPTSDRGRALLREIFAFGKWVEDTVIAKGEVKSKPSLNEANLSFNYCPNEKDLEIEILEYTIGSNWIDDQKACVSHVGVHVTEDELELWRDFFKRKKISVIQSVDTQVHSNGFLKNRGRKYHYEIYHTRSYIGTDLKFIVRIEE